jgi:8-oxo-dGTP diphosphatase
MYTGEYVPPTLTIDCVVFQLDDEKGLSVLLIQRTQDPFKGAWALPGAYCAAGETTKEAMHRMLKAKAGVEADRLGLIEQLHTFDTVARDPRGHAVSVAYMGLGRDIAITKDSGLQNPQFFPLSSLPGLAYDHAEIIALATQRLQAKLSYTNVAFALMTPTFTLSQLQTAYEAIVQHAVDKRNFRKKIISLGILKDTGKMDDKRPYRPARLYEFAHKELRSLDHIYD